MKLSFCYIFFLCLLFCIAISCKTTNKIDSDQYYKVTKIDSITNYYIIYIKGGEAQYKIVSKKEDSSHCSRIKVGKGYPIFVLEKLIRKERYITGDYIFKVANSNMFVPDCIKMDDNKTEVCRDQGLDNIYKTLNLRGLHYINLPSEKEKKYFLPPLKLNHY